MNIYYYKARNNEGKLVSGEVETTTESQAARLIRDKGLIAVSIKQQRGGLSGILKSLRSKVTASDVTAFTRQLSTMVSAGLPITESLLVLRNQAKVNFQKIVAQIMADIEGGKPLSKAFEAHPKLFSPTYIALIKSGEAGGVLDKVLIRLADNMEKDQQFRGKIKGAMIYPVIIVVGMFAVGMIMMVFVLPKMTSLYTEFGATLPLPTRVLMGISDFMVKFWPVVIGTFFGIGWGFSLYRKTPVGRRKTDSLFFKIPILGDLQRQVVLTELTRTLSLMTSSGVSIIEGLNITSGVVGNTIISDALKDVSIQVEKGFPVSYAFARHPDAFPFILSQMMAVGEETGKTDEILQKLSRIFEIESDEKVKALTASIEPIIMLVLGVGVAFLVIAIIMPIYNLTSSF